MNFIFRNIATDLGADLPNFMGCLLFMYNILILPTYCLPFQQLIANPTFVFTPLLFDN